MPDPAKYKAWLDNNADKAGTPNYVKVSEAYAQMQDTPFSDVSGPAGAGISPELMNTANDVRNVAQRAVINRFTAIPDLGVALANIGSKYGVFPETKLPYVGSMVNKALGGQDMPADAPWWQRAGEGMLAGGVSGLGGGVRGVAQTMVPSALSIAGAEGGAALGQATGLDPELLSIIGGVGGGSARTTVPDTARAVGASLYRGSGRENAGAVYDAAVRTGTTPTGAMLGNQDVNRLEQVLERRPGSGPSIAAARQQARNQFTDAAGAVPPAAGATLRDPTEIGRLAQTTAGDALTALENATARGNNPCKTRSAKGRRSTWRMSIEPCRVWSIGT